MTVLIRPFYFLSYVHDYQPNALLKNFIRSPYINAENCYLISILQSIGLEIEMLKTCWWNKRNTKKDEVELKSIIISFYSYCKKKVHKKLNGLSQDKTILYVNSKWWQWLGAKYCLVLSRRVIQYFCHQSQNFNWECFWITYTIALKYIITYHLFVIIYL